MGKRRAKGRLRPFPGSPRQRCLRRQQQQQRQMQQQQQRQQQQQQQRQQQHRQRRRRGRRGRRPGQGPGRAAMGLAGLPEKVLAGKSKIYSPRRSKRCSRMRSSLRGDASGVYLSVRCRGRPVTRSYSKPEEKRKSRREPSTLKSDKPKRRGPRRGRPARLPKPKSQVAEPPKSQTSSCHPRKAAVTKPGPKKPIKGQQVRRGRCRGKPQQNRKLTDSYPVRRSSRKSKAELQSEERRRIDELIASGKEEGMKIGLIDGKGRGVIATKQFSRGQFIVEYHGDLIEITDAKKREALYAQDPSTGCYMYYFQYLSKTYCIDATRETNRLGRLINHSKRGNCQTKLHDVAGVPHLILIASRDIQAGEELLYDYGDRSRESLEAHPWLKH